MTTYFIAGLVIYILFLTMLIIGWRRYPFQPVWDRFFFLSVIIPFRNEEKNIPTLIENLRKLDYPRDRFEIILIDDHSDDSSEAMARQLTGNLSNIKIISAKLTGKKQAIAQGIEESIGDIIVTTDADCELPTKWLKSVNSQFQNRTLRMLIGPVKIKSDDTFFSILQSMEFSSLLGSAAATLNLGFPTMCNGANLSYTKESFYEVNGFQGNEHIPSGDDEFLMRRVVKKFGVKSLKFLNDTGAVVSTNSQTSIRDLLTQRIRWAGKWSQNSNWFTKLLAVFILFFQALWLVAIGSLFFLEVDYVMLSLLSLKIGIEAYFLFSISRFMQQKFSWYAFFVLQIVYPFYVVLVAVISNFISVSWKSRSIRNRL